MNASGPDNDNKDGKVSQTVTSPAPGAGIPGSAKASKAQTNVSGLAAMVLFVKESMVELRKITWPDRQQVIKETLSVIVLVAIITACVLAFDYGVAKVIFEPLDKLARHLGGGIGVHH